MGLRVVFAGTPEFALPSLEALLEAHDVVAVYTQPDRPAGRGRKLRPSPVKQCATAAACPVQQPASLRGAEAQQALAAWQPDLMVVVAYGLILPPAVLAIPRLGCVNVHASLLPRWRGAAPIQRAILAGDRATGVTIMQMDAGLDTGPMLLRRTLPVGDRLSAAEVHDALAHLGAAALLDVLQQWESGAAVVAEPQDDSVATYAEKITKAEAQLDWRQPAVQLARAVRAFNPWPVAYTQWDTAQLRIWQARVLTQAAAAPPGQVVEAARGRIVVATGAGALEIERLQLPGGRPLAARDFLNAHSLAGARLGGPPA